MTRLDAPARGDGARGRRFLLLLLLMQLALPNALAGQNLLTGSIEGRVRDARGGAGIVVITVTEENGLRRTVVRSDRLGRFTIPFLTPGTYSVLMERLGYRPERVDGVPVVAGERTQLAAELVASTPEQTQVRVSRFAGTVPATTQALPPGWLAAPSRAAALPFDGLGLADVVRTAAGGGWAGELEGMPASMRVTLIDGIPWTPRPWPTASWFRGNMLTLGLLESADVRTPTDVEFPGSAGGYISAATIRGTDVTSGWLAGDFANDAMAGGDPASFNGYRAAGRVSGSLSRDTATFVIGAEYERSAFPLSSIWPASAEATALATAARDQRDRDLNAYAGAATSRVERISGFARVDAVLAERHRVSLRGMVSNYPSIAPAAYGREIPFGHPNLPVGTEWFLSASMMSRLGETDRNELSLGFELSETGRGTEVVPANSVLPGTGIIDNGLSFGFSNQTRYTSRFWSAYIRDAIYLRRGAHEFKFGFDLSFPTWDLPPLMGRAGEVWFPTTTQFGSGAGLYRQTRGLEPRAEFQTREGAIFAQDRWFVSPGLEITAGARLMLERLVDTTTTTIPLDAKWFQFTLLDNRLVPRRRTEIEPRLGLTWRSNSGEWTLNASARADAIPVDTRVIAEVLTNWGGSTIVTGFGNIPAWPQFPDSSDANLQRPTLTLLGPEFTGPRSTRLHASLSRSLGAALRLTAYATYRRTQFLPQRKDLNRTPAVAGRDQHGRPLYGRLRKEGGLVFADGDSNRRFNEFSNVWVIESTGELRYTGFGLAVDASLGSRVRAIGRYERSSTEGDWRAGDNHDPLTMLHPFPDSTVGGDWADGRSELDVPTRGLAGLELTLPGSFAPRLALLYRYQSGYPFTPGFRDGVDVNADGSGRNDTAFIDDGIAGMAALLDAWPCLRENVGRFAERNSCRGPDLHSLDARLAVTLLRGRRTAELVLDGLNLIATEAGVYDRAVYLLDPDADLVVSANGRTTELPLVANPNFGQVLARMTPQRLLRAGLRVRF